MNEEFLLQLKNINYAFSRVHQLAQDYVLNAKDIPSSLNQISASLEKLNTNFGLYQSTITNQPWFQFILGSAVTLAVTLLLEYLRNRKAKNEYLYYLERLVVDQVNSVIEIKETANRFLARLDGLLKNIEGNPSSAYSVDVAFFPLFSARPFPEDVNKSTSGSGYIDNKVGKIYALSKDLPHIVDDMRLQLRETFEMNQKIAFGRLNSSEIQKEQYKRNIQAYQKMIKDELLQKNIPIYTKKLVETLVIVREKTRRYSIVWKVKFDPWWKFYFKKSDYVKARECIVDSMDKYFEAATKKQLEDIEKF